jgi:hypothetical protein
MTHGSPLNLANIVLKNLKSQVIRYIEFLSLIIIIQHRFVNQWKDGDQHSAKTAVCTNYITVTVTVKIKIFMGQWVNPTDP